MRDKGGNSFSLFLCFKNRVAQSPDTKMDVNNLAKVFGPTIVAHAVPDPDPMTLLQDTKRQPKVGEQEELLWANGFHLKNPTLRELR